MLHSVKQQHKYRCRVWSSCELVTSDKGPYVYLLSRREGVIAKMAVKEVVLWPRYNPFLLAERQKTMSAVRSLCVRGCLLPLTADDRAIVAEARRRGAPAAPSTSGPSRAAHTATERVDQGGAAGDAAAQASVAEGKFTPDGSSSRATPRTATTSRDSGNPRCYLSDSNGDMSDEVSVTDPRLHTSDIWQPEPAGLTFVNPLTARTNPPRRHSGSIAHTGGAAAGIDADADVHHEGEVHDGDSDTEAGQPGRATRSSRRWVLRCQTLDDLRALVRAMQGVSDYAASDPDAISRAVPATAFVGSLEELEKEVIHKSVHKGH